MSELMGCCYPAKLTGKKGNATIFPSSECCSSHFHTTITNHMCTIVNDDEVNIRIEIIFLSNFVCYRTTRIVKIVTIGILPIHAMN